MKRRDLISTLPFTGYSLLVFAGEGMAEPQAPGMVRDFETIAPPRGRSRSAAQEPNMALVELSTDVVVAGGGLAGVCAAISAARHGARVVLLQDRSRLGGNSSSEVKMHVVGASCHKGRPGWREGGLIEEFRLDDAVNNPQRCWELWDLLLYDKVASEPNIRLLLETTLYSAAMEDGRIRSVMARCDKSEVLYRIQAPVFVDATGDSRLALEAGAAMRVGRESRSEFGESLAPTKADGETLGSSILFTSRDYDRPMPYRPPAWARKVTKEQLRFRPTSSWEYGYWWIEWGGQIDPIRDNERIRHELLAIVTGVWDYIKNSGDHADSANWALDWVGMMPGRRGSRRVEGDVLVTQQMLMKGEFDDAVAMGGWPMDDHPPSGFDKPDMPPNTVIRTPEVFNLPLRSMYSRSVPNLMLAGRNISCTHAAFTSTRVMATCACVGQAVGTAAARCVRDRIAPRQLAQDPDRLKQMQQALLKDDQSLRGIRNEDPMDLALRASSVEASAEEPHSPARSLMNGWVRSIPQRETNQWAGRMGADGAWIELRWAEPVRISEVRVTFDTGFQRELTLTASESINKGIIRAAQPETVKDYALLAGSKPLASVTANYQRLRVHRFDPVETDRLRLHVTATNGSDFARVFEIRCYS